MSFSGEDYSFLLLINFSTLTMCIRCLTECRGTLRNASFPFTYIVKMLRQNYTWNWAFCIKLVSGKIVTFVSRYFIDFCSCV